LRGNSGIGRIPFVGPYFEGVLTQAGYRRVDDIVRGFTGFPPLTARQIETLLVRMCQNPRRDTCTADAYHVSDANQCLFNALVRLLREAHRRRNDWQQYRFSTRPNVPNADRVALRVRAQARTRGDQARLRTCACQGNEQDCRERRCRWVTPEEANSALAPNGACVPRAGFGFVGDRRRTNQQTSAIPPQAQVRLVDNLPYVQQYRILSDRAPNYEVPRAPARGQVRRGRPLAAPRVQTRAQARRRRRGTTTTLRAGKKALLSGGAMLRRAKREIVHEESWNGGQSTDARRHFNQQAMAYNNQKKKNKPDACKAVCQGPSCCQLQSWFLTPVVGKWKHMMAPSYFETFMDAGW
jgi:hypothetical protein